MEFKTAYGPRERVSISFPEGSGRTHQTFKDESDVNNILAKYRKTGLVTHLNKYEGQYGQFGSAGDFHAAMSLVTHAQQMFETLPSDIRAKFRNDPAAFLDFTQNPDNLEEMIEMGLAKRPPRSPEEEEARNQLREKPIPADPSQEPLEGD